jgi:ADP-L-glycero-D-manno-heptose 6-epimerase
MPLSIRNQYQYFTQADISKIKKAGYNKPLTTLENAVTDYITNYIQPAKYLSADNF